MGMHLEIFYGPYGKISIKEKNDFLYYAGYNI
jgi:hypothetical protein